MYAPSKGAPVVPKELMCGPENVCVVTLSSIMNLYATFEENQFGSKQKLIARFDLNRKTRSKVKYIKSRFKV